MRGATLVTASPLPIGCFPTPIERLDPLPLWIKRDDRAATLYGGNKVRKLERLLAEARAAGKRRILTVGTAGSHQVLATALYGAREGFAVEAVLVRQPASAHARRNLRAALASGLEPVAGGSWAAAPALLATRVRRDAYVIPVGGSSLAGTLAFVDAAKELAAQVAAGAMPEPEAIVVAMGSGGTAAGLAVGLELAGLGTRVVGVVVSPPVRLVAAMARRLATKAAAAVGLPRSADPTRRLEVERRWLGRGYAHPSAEGAAAMAAAARVGLALDPTYTAKAFACALDAQRSARGPVLFWHTLSSAPLDAILEGAPELPPELDALFG